MEENIYILSEPIRSGKTTALLEFCNQQLSVGGVITPDVNGIRKIYYPREKKYADLQIENEKEGITVGKFNFSNDAFSNARSVLQELDFDEYSWIIVDEIGKLELLSANGFEPELSKLIKRFKDYNGATKLLLVIRDSLLQLGRGFYDLKFAKVISIADLKLIQAKSTIPENLLGVILCGGQSSRMGFEKFLANYHGLPQYKYLSSLFDKLNIEIVISIKAQQISLVEGDSKLVVDNESYENAGPLTGLLSVHEQYPNKSILLVGCDYPLLKIEHLTLLLINSRELFPIVCYHNNGGFDEPLIAYYSNEALRNIKLFYERGNTSLQQFIKSTNVKRLMLDNSSFLTSVDTPLEHEFILSQITAN